MYLSSSRSGPSPLPASRALELDLHVDAGGKVELHQRIDGLRGRVDDVEQALVGAHLELLAALLVDVRRAVDGEFLDPRRQRDGAAYIGPGAFRRRHDLARRGVEHPMVKRLEADTDVLAVHLVGSFKSSRARAMLAPATDPVAFLFRDAGDDAGADGTSAF